MSNRARTGIIVVALLAVMATVNYFGGEAPWENGSGTESEAHAVDSATADVPAEAMPGEYEELIPALDPIGPEDAPVMLEVFYEEVNDCHGGISDSASELAIRYTPHLRLKLLPWNAEGTEERADELDAHCLVAIALSTREDDGSWGPGEVLFISPPDIGEWTWGDVEGHIVTRLNEAGIEISAEEILAGSSE